MKPPQADPAPPRKRWRRLTAAFLFAFPLLVAASTAMAAKAGPGGDKGIVGSPIVLVVVLGAMALLPFILVMITSFVKIAVVLSIIRSALGTQQIPPTQVITGMAIILTVYVMVPVGLEIKDQTIDLIRQSKGEGIKNLVSTRGVRLMIKAAMRAKEPLRRFLLKHGHEKDRFMFYSLALRLRKKAEHRKGLKPTDLIIVVPSFVISELKEAFQIGFLIFIPFIVIDMVVANILLALGMHMLAPTVISLPFKLLLFVMVDGWYLITKGLILGYL